MKKLFTILVAAIFAVDAMAEFGYGVNFTQNDFNNASTVVKTSGTIEWDSEGAVRCGGSSTGITSGPAWNWDEKSFDVHMATGVPAKLTFQYKGNAGGSTGVTFKVQESANGSDWSEVWSTTSNTTSYKSISKDLALSTRYLRFSFAGNFAGLFKDIKVTEKILMGTPNPTALDFGTVRVDDVVEAQTFTIGWTNLEAAVTGGTDQFAVTPETFGEIGAYTQTATISVALNTSVAGEYNTTVHIAGRGKSADVPVTANVIKHDQSINWNVAESVNFGETIVLASATSGLDVEYEIANPNVLKFENGAFVTLYAGTTEVTAKQAGNYKYNAATNVVKTITVVAPTTYGEFSEATCGEAVEFNEQTYEESFAGEVHLTNIYGGDSVVTVAITINHPTFGTDEKTIVYGADESWNGIALKDSAVGAHSVVAVLTNAAGCDSTVTLTLTVNKMETLNVPVDLQFCAGGSDFFRGVEYSEAGTYPVNVTGATCDTVYNVTVTVLQPTTGTDTKTIVYGADESWNGISLKDSTVGVHYVVYETTNVAGCDSTVTLSLTVNKMDALEVYYPIGFCAGDSAEYRGKWYYESGEDTILVEDAIQDTLIYVTIAVLPTDLSELKADTLYVGDTLFIEADTWYLGEELIADTIIVPTEAGEFDLTQTLKNEALCDSVIIRHIVVETKPETPTALDTVGAANKAVKVLRDGVLYIRRGERLFTAEGREVK